MKTDDLHPGQIPTTRAAIRRELWDKSYDIITVLLKCISLAPDSYGFINQAVVAASLLERVSCLVYKGKDGVWRKLPEEAYKTIFVHYAETEEEVAERLADLGVPPERAGEIFRTLRRIAALVCPMMACVTEQAFVSEYAYAIEYAVRHGGDLPKPVIEMLFPTNYPDYDSTQGVAALIREAAGTII